MTRAWPDKEASVAGGDEPNLSPCSAGSAAVATSRRPLPTGKAARPRHCSSLAPAPASGIPHFEKGDFSASWIHPSAKTCNRAPISSHGSCLGACTFVPAHILCYLLLSPASSNIFKQHRTPGPWAPGAASSEQHRRVPGLLESWGEDVKGIAAQLAERPWRGGAAEPPGPGRCLQETSPEQRSF